MTPAVRPFCVWGEAGLERVRRCVHETLQAWARDWRGVTPGATPGPLEVQVMALDSTLAPPPGELEAVHGAAATLWVRRRASDRSACAEAVVGADLLPGGSAADDWVAQALDRAWSVRNRALCQALLGERAPEVVSPPPQAVPAELFAVGSGALQIRCDVLGLHALVDRHVMRDTPPAERGRAAPRLAPTVSIEQAIGPARLRVEALLGSVELELEQLLDLRRGDVLRLPQRLDRPLSLTCEDRPLAGVRLGEAHGLLAVQGWGRPTMNPPENTR